MDKLPKRILIAEDDRSLRKAAEVTLNGSGYRGRLAVFELFAVDDRIREMIVGGVDGAAIRTAAIAGA